MAKRLVKEYLHDASSLMTAAKKAAFEDIKEHADAMDIEAIEADLRMIRDFDNIIDAITEYV